MEKLRYEYLLPIGSVVQLYNGEQKVMICGVLQKGLSTGERTFDYVAVPYPMGEYDPRIKIGFDHTDIENIIFRGYEDEERKAFLVFLEAAARSKKIANKKMREQDGEK